MYIKAAFIDAFLFLWFTGLIALAWWRLHSLIVKNNVNLNENLLKIAKFINEK